MPELEPEPAPGFVRLHNPATGDPWDCPEAAVDDWVERGWTKTPKAGKAKTAKEG